MQNFNWSEFTEQIAIKAPVADVYNAWTITEEIEKWFLSKAEYYHSGILIPKEKNIEKESKYKWWWFAQDTNEEGHVTEANDKDRFVFTFAGDCKVEVNLSSADGYTLVSLRHSNIPDDDASKEGIRLGCAFGWSFYLVNLKSYLEGGIDLRNKDRQFNNVVNN